MMKNLYLVGGGGGGGGDVLLVKCGGFLAVTGKRRMMQFSFSVYKGRFPHKMV